VIACQIPDPGGGGLRCIAGPGKSVWGPETRTGLREDVKCRSGGSMHGREDKIRGKIIEYKVGWKKDQKGKVDKGRAGKRQKTLCSIYVVLFRHIYKLC